MRTSPNNGRKSDNSGLERNTIESQREIQMIKLGKRVMTALVMGALIAGLSCCQKKEGPVETRGEAN